MKGRKLFLIFFQILLLAVAFFLFLHRQDGKDGAVSVFFNKKESGNFSNREMKKGGLDEFAAFVNQESRVGRSKVSQEALLRDSVSINYFAIKESLKKNPEFLSTEPEIKKCFQAMNWNDSIKGEEISFDRCENFAYRLAEKGYVLVFTNDNAEESFFLKGELKKKYFKPENGLIWLYPKEDDFVLPDYDIFFSEDLNAGRNLAFYDNGLIVLYLARMRNYAGSVLSEIFVSKNVDWENYLNEDANFFKSVMLHEIGHAVLEEKWQFSNSNSSIATGFLPEKEKSLEVGGIDFQTGNDLHELVAMAASFSADERSLVFELVHLARRRAVEQQDEYSPSLDLLEYFLKKEVNAVAYFELEQEWEGIRRKEVGDAEKRRLAGLALGKLLKSIKQENLIAMRRDFVEVATHKLGLIGNGH